jgi:hypothetical protein
MWSNSFPLKTSSQGQDHNLHNFNHYADKQLEHLVISEEFDFAKIAELLSKISII